MVKSHDSYSQVEVWVLTKTFRVVTGLQVYCEVRMDHGEGPLHYIGGKEGQPYLTCYMSSQYIFYSFYTFPISEEGKKSMLDHLETKGKGLVALVLYWCL